MALRPTIFLVLLWLVCLTANASTWYVDSSVTASGNGTAWTNAWKALSNISGVKAGDTVYISGGVSGASQTYAVSGWRPIMGTTGSPVTYQIGQDALHNGTAIFSGSGNWLSGWLQNVTISGNAGDGKMHFSLANPANNVSYYNEAWSNPGASTYSFGVHIAYVNFGQIPVAFDTWPIESPAIEIDHTWAYIGVGADHWGNFSTVMGNGYDSGLLIHDCTMYLPCNANSAVGCDGIQASGNGLSFYDNTLISYVGNGINHQDSIQCLTMAYVKIYGNLSVNMGQSAIFGDNFSAPQHIRIYNNIMLDCANGIEMGDDGGSTGPFAFNDIVVANNLDIGGNGGSGIASHWPGSTFTSCLFANNIMVGVGQITGPYYSGQSSENVTTAAAAAASLFMGYSTTTNGNFHLTSTATNLIGKGVNLSADFTTDFEGNTRSATGGWDIGPYAYTNSGVIVSTNPPPTDTNFYVTNVDVGFEHVWSEQASFNLKSSWTNTGRLITNIDGAGIVSGSPTMFLRMYQQTNWPVWTNVTIETNPPPVSTNASAAITPPRTGQ
jgi:hypothetical protein